MEATSESAAVLEIVEICDEMEETTLLMLASVEVGVGERSGSSNPGVSVDVVFGALLIVGCTITGAVPVAPVP